MKRVAQLLNEMRDSGVITDYAVFGDVARDRLAELAGRYGIGEAWRRFEAKFLNE